MKQKIRKLSAATGRWLRQVNGSYALDPQKPMPPDFSIENEPSRVLHDYPLDVINQQELLHVKQHP